MLDWKSLVRTRLVPLRLTPAAEDSLVEEIAQHLEDCYRDLLAGGATEQAAFQGALARFGGLDELRAAAPSRMPRRDDAPPGSPSRGTPLDGLGRDVRFALRSMRRSPVFVAFVVLTLGLGIGANTTVFTLINSLILDPLPVENAAGLAAVAATRTPGTSAAPAPLSLAALRDYAVGSQVFESLAAYTSPRVITQQQGDATERMFCEFATANYFTTLGVKPAGGRFFLPEEDVSPGTHPVAVLNYGTWQRRFGGADMLGKPLRINHLVLTVVGVAPRGFIGVNGVMGPDVWVPAAMAERLLPEEMRGALTDRAKAVFSGVGRLRPGVTRTEAQANLDTIAASLAHEYSDTDRGHGIVVRPIRDAILSTLGAGSGAGVLWGGAALLVVVGIVLLIACSNVANLLMARATARRKEMAVRLAMGASRARLLRQLLTESMLLGLASGVFGILAAYGGLQLIFGTLPAAANFAAPRLDSAVFAFVLLISLATGFLFGTVPALRTSRIGVAEALKQEARTAGRSRGGATLANALLVGQVAFSFLLLMTAALFLRSIGRAYQMDPGFQTAHLAMFMTNPGQAGYGAAATRAFYRDLREQTARLPGVLSVSWSSNLPLWGRAAAGLEIEGFQRRFQSDELRAIVNIADRDYFETAGVALRAGRAFGDLDGDSSAPVAIVNEKLAQDYWPAGALGKRIRLPGEREMRQVVGIARNANYTTWNEPPQPCVYVPLAQHPSEAMTLFVRTRGEPGDVLLPVEREIRAAGPGILFDSRTGAEIVNGGLFAARVAVALLAIFGLLALGLASIGLYGILLYSVDRRRREIGVRMALGAGAPAVLRLVLREGMSLVLVGIAAGYLASLGAGRLLRTMLYGVGVSDPVSVAAAAVTLCAVALLACVLPARRATRVDPLAALREG
jgi:predicted permease